MTKIEQTLVGIAYVAKLLIGVAGMVATGLLGVSGLPVSWKVPLMAVAAVAGAVALYKTPNGSSPSVVKMWRELDAAMMSGAFQPPAPTTDPEPPADSAEPEGA